MKFKRRGAGLQDVLGAGEDKVVEIIVHQKRAEDDDEVALVSGERSEGADNEGHDDGYTCCAQEAKVVGEHALAARQRTHEGVVDLAALVAQAIDQPQQKEVLEGVPGVIALEED